MFKAHGGIFKHEFLLNLLPSSSVKKFENRFIFGEVMGRSLMSCFFDSRCIVLFSIISAHLWIERRLLYRRDGRTDGHPTVT